MTTLEPPPVCASGPAPLADGVLRGDRISLARAITLIESNAPAHRPRAREVLQAVAGQAATAERIGISGPPGAGKSTFIEALGNLLCDRGRRVAVLAVDPSSSVSGGSILGDKTRMTTLAQREECFIRPSPSRGALGGVARKTRETILLCEAAGYDTILIETVGVGQSEFAVRSMVDCLVLLLLAGAGDELQGMKKGILEIADLLVINKADGANLDAARAARRQLAAVLPLIRSNVPGWKIPVLAISSLAPEGPATVWEAVTRYFTLLRDGGGFAARRTEQTLAWWKDLVSSEIQARALADPRVAAVAEHLEAEVAAGRLAPSLAAEDLLDRIFPPSRL